MRGEYPSFAAPIALTNGSPPRAWGIRGLPSSQLRQKRFTPTCVGNTIWLVVSVVPTTVHPHVRGEYTGRAPNNFKISGSPPRAWGIRCCAPTPKPAARFTPTCVGNTDPLVSAMRSFSVHPHVRGEYTGYGLRVLGGNGSPPRAWGIRTPTSRNRPAVGSPPRAWGIPIACRTKSSASGSPPRAWGIPAPSVSWPVSTRFTPTCVGNTNIPYFVTIRPRFTPTCVGNTNLFIVDRIEHTVHPHVRGEYTFPHLSIRVKHGSPPRAWGILYCDRYFCLASRFTPTCVGNTLS